MRGIVQRCQCAEFFYFINDIGRYKAAVRENAAALHYAVTDSRNFIKRINNLSVALCKGVNHRLKSLAVGGHGGLGGVFSAVGSLVRNSARNAYSFAKTLCEYLLVIHINKLIFQRGAARVYNKNFHTYNFL